MQMIFASQINEMHHQNVVANLCILQLTKRMLNNISYFVQNTNSNLYILRKNKEAVDKLLLPYYKQMFNKISI